MLKGQALAYYYSQKSTWKIKNIPAFQGVKDYFEGAEQQRSKQDEWSSITFQGTIDQNEGKTIKECLEIMLQRLQQLYYSLPEDIRNDTFHRMKLIEATRKHPACEWATSKPATTSAGLIQDLRTNVSQYQDKNQDASSINFTDY